VAARPILRAPTRRYDARERRRGNPAWAGGQPALGLPLQKLGKPERVLMFGISEPWATLLCVALVITFGAGMIALVDAAQYWFRVRDGEPEAEEPVDEPVEC
jgi:hypothetical protein